jgi:hypothetical protein
VVGFAISIVFAKVLPGVFFRSYRKSRYRGRKTGGFNCCEFCREPLRRHRVQTWRYDGVCAACGRTQGWAGGTAPAESN